MTTITVTLHEKPDGDIILLSHNPNNPEEQALTEKVLKAANLFDVLVEALEPFSKYTVPKVNHGVTLYVDGDDVYNARVAYQKAIT